MQKKVLRSLLAVAAAATLAACATSTPVTRSVKPASATPPEAASAAPKAPANSRGYRRVVKDGKELFCQREIMTGSRTSASETCLTQEQLTLQAQKNQDYLRQWQNYPGKQVEPANGRMIDATTIR